MRVQLKYELKTAARAQDEPACVTSAASLKAMGYPDHRIEKVMRRAGADDAEVSTVMGQL